MDFEPTCGICQNKFLTQAIGVLACKHAFCYYCIDTNCTECPVCHNPNLSPVFPITFYNNNMDVSEEEEEEYDQMEGNPSSYYECEFSLTITRNNNLKRKVFNLMKYKEWYESASEMNKDLIQKIKEISARNEALEARNEALEARNKMLEEAVGNGGVKEEKIDLEVGADL